MPITTAAMTAIAFVIKDEQILLMQHAQNSWARGKWSVLGGKVEPGETPEQAVRRELEEESGLRMTRYRQAGHIFLCGSNVTSIDLFVVTEYEGKLTGSAEGEPVWWPLSALDQLPLVEYLQLLLPLVLEPDAFVIGTIHVTSGTQPVAHSLQQHRIAESRVYEGR